MDFMKLTSPPPTSKPSTTDKPGSLESNLSTETFLTSLAINGIIAFIVLLLFSLLRRKHKHIYSPRLILLETKFPLGKLPRSIFSWFIPALMAKDDDVYNYAGFDALVYMRFLKLCVKISLLILPYGMAVLLPLNIYGGHDGTGLPKMTMSNLLEDSPKMWAHFAAVWVYTFLIYYLLYEEWRMFIVYRQEYLSKGLYHQYAVVVRDMPSRLCNEESMMSHVDYLFPDQVEDVVMVEELSRWEKMMSKHDTFVWKLEKAKFELDRTRKRPIYQSNPFDRQWDAITYYENELKRLQVKLEDEMDNIGHHKFSCSFVIFKSLKFSTQALFNNSPLIKGTLKVFPAPVAKDIIWDNLPLGPLRRRCRFVLVMMIVLLIIIFYFIPVGFVSSLIALDRLKDLIPFLKHVDELPEFIRLFAEGFLSSLALLIFFAILPMVLRYLSKKQGLVSMSEVEMSTLAKLFVFKVINQFLFLTVGAALKELEIMIKNPHNIATYLGKTLPSLSSFFLSFLMLCSFTAYPLELLRPVPLLINSIKRTFCHMTPREDRESWRPPHAPYDALFADHLLMLIIGLCYSVMAPLVSLFVLFYFAFGYVVWMNQVLCVYIPTYSCGGLMWPVLFKRIIACVVVFHLVMIGIFSLKDMVAIPSLLIPLPIFTIIFQIFMQRYTFHASSHLSDVIADALPEGSPTVLQVAAKEYTRNHKLPPEFGLSTDRSTKNISGYQEIPEYSESSLLLTPKNKRRPVRQSRDESHFKI